MSAYQGLTLNAMLLLFRHPLLAMATLAAIVLAGCAAPRPDPATHDDTRCTAPAPGDSLVGNWLSVRKQSGVAGELRTHIVLHADGTMSYGEQLSRRGRAPQ